MRPGLALEQEVAELFRRAGFDVESPATLTGARARHTVDVLVKYDNPLGDLETWVVECKDLAGRAKKEHVIRACYFAPPLNLRPEWRWSRLAAEPCARVAQWPLP